MSRYRYGAGGKRDDNEPDIIKALRAHGCVVMQLSGKGIPDLLVLRKGKKWLADVKMPCKPTTEAQEELWEEAATKAQCAVFILRTPEDAVKMLNNALAPWEPAQPTKAERIATRLRALGMRATVVVDGEKKGSIRAPRPHGDDKRPKAGDAARARAEGRKRLGMGHAIEPLTNDASSIKARTNYTPPRSKPVDAAKPKGMGMHIHDQDPAWLKERIERSMDAAKEAEETFAPDATVADDCGCRREQPCALHSHYVGTGES